MRTKIVPRRHKSNHGKHERWASQQLKAFLAFKKYPQTRLMVSHSTGVPLQNLCRYVKNFRDAHTIYIVKTDRCPISGMRAEFLSTDPRYAPSSQLKMFE